jgi:hypothetical protein
MACSGTLLRAAMLGLLPFLAACNQTVQAPAAPDSSAPVGSGAVAAIMDAERTRAAHQASSTAMNIASSFDPTGLSGYAVQAVEEAQERELEEKYRRIDEEVEKALAQAEAAQALSEEMTLSEEMSRKEETSRKPPARHSKAR